MICSENKNEDKTGGVGLGIILVSESANGSHPGLDPSGFIKTVSEDTVFFVEVFVFYLIVIRPSTWESTLFMEESSSSKIEKSSVMTMRGFLLAITSSTGTLKNSVKFLKW